MTAGIDSMILVYAGMVPRSAKNRVNTAEYKKLTMRAKILLHNLRNDMVILPMVAISELLIPVEQSKRGLLIVTLAEKFVCPDFDEKAAAIAADIWVRYKELPDDLDYENRHVLRADCLIVATAKAAGASDFYTNDDNCRALANLVMRGRQLPTHSEDLFIGEMLESGETEVPRAPKKKTRRKRK